MKFWKYHSLISRTLYNNADQFLLSVSSDEAVLSAIRSNKQKGEQVSEQLKAKTVMTELDTVTGDSSKQASPQTLSYTVIMLLVSYTDAGVAHNEGKDQKDS